MKTLFAIACLLFFFKLGANAADSTLVNMGDLWSYVKVPFQIVQPAAGWAEVGFDDAGWGRSRSGFDLEHTHVGLQDVTAKAPPARMFLRHRFQVEDRAAIRSLRLRVEHEVGFKAYLNGKLVGTVSEPGVALVRQDPFLPNEEDAVLTTADLDLTSSRELLREGDNVLALEGDQTWRTVSPITLSGLLTANISRGPFVQNTTPNGLVIAWRTELPFVGAVQYGRTRSLGSEVAEAAPGTRHAITLSGLEPDTHYFYRVTNRDPDGGEVVSAVDFFRTFRERGPVHFAFIADTGQNTAAQFTHARILADLAPELVLHGGDIIYGGFDDLTPDSRVFAPYLRDTGQMGNTPFYFSLGNHDLNCCGGDPKEWNPTNMALNAFSFQNTFYLPTNSATGTEHFYSFDHGDVHFVALYNPWFTVYDFTASTEQYRWLTNDLASSTKPWKILFFHSPMAHSGPHASADRNLNGVLDHVDLSLTLGPVAATYGVQLILNGHEHNYERFVPTNGVHSVVSGGGGAGLYGFSSPHPRSAQFLSANQCLNVEISGDTATLQAVTTNMTILDQWVIQKTAPIDQIYYASWNSPKVEAEAATDRDGNITGQSFDFVGDPILPRMGQHSNLGFCYVNNDSTNLYVGFASVMLAADANLFLFVGSERALGVETLKGVGNGVIDPLLEGADGLDCLENVAFKGFRPGIGCLLGDEYGDGTSRSNRRPRLALNIGQGVFSLGSSLSPVPGTRVQQFNRSPQTPLFGLPATEQNADFIEVSIPLASLGNVLPGETVKLAAFVGLGGFDTNLMIRVIDTALLGTGMLADEGGRVVVQPVSVKLSLPSDLDEDGDGLPDGWETAHGLDPKEGKGQQGADGDVDHDGDSNLREFLAGTDPQDSRSALRLRLIPGGDRVVRISWPAVPAGRRAVVQYSEGGLENFVDYVRPISGLRRPMFETIFTDDLRKSPGVSQRNYRLRLEP